jgi:hypothetical protein
MNVLEEGTQFKKILTDFRQSLGALKDDHAEWREYDEFYLSKHWTTQRASWLPDPVINYVAYVVDQKSPQLTNNRPKGLILPTTQNDEQVAKLFTQVTDVIAERVDLDEVIGEVVPTGLLLGIGWFKVYWDNSLSGGSVQAGTVWKGDVCIESPDPTNIYHDPQAHRVEDCRYIIYAVPKTVEWVKEKFDVIVDADQQFETDIYSRPSLQQSKNRVMMYEYWYKENGTINVIYAAGGKQLKKIEKVYKHGQYPFVAFVPKKKRKSLTGIGEPKNIIANQKLLNKFYEMLTRNTMLTANPILFVDAKSGIDPNKFVAKPGVIQPVNDLYQRKPAEWFQPPQISGDVPLTIDKLRESIERMSGVYDANTGQTPTGVTAAAAIQMLVEQGSIPIKGIKRNLNMAIRDVYELMIELVKENYTEQRYIRITDDQGNMQFHPFVGAQFAEVDLDVKVNADDSAPTSKAYIAQLGADLFHAGVLLGSEYVDMQDGLPNKDRIVQRLREQETMQQQQAQMQAQMAQQPQVDLNQQAQMQAEQQAMAQQQEQQKAQQQFEQQMALKQMDNHHKMTVEEMKAQVALQQAQMRQPVGK